MNNGISVLIGLLVLALASPAGANRNDNEDEEPAKITVQHVLVGFKRSVKGKQIDRTKAEAQQLAEDVLETAQAGVEFADLVKRYTDDRYPGIYTLVNKGETPVPGEFKRYDMMTCFGNIAFQLEVDEIGMADYHATRCKFGWHIIKRIE